MMGKNIWTIETCTTGLRAGRFRENRVDPTGSEARGTTQNPGDNQDRALVEQVILVDPEGRQIGTCEKLAAHQRGGRLHLAFSIFVYNRQEELLLQKRAATKYHFASLWSNTCCGHPRPGEQLVDAAGRRLKEEFGFTTTLRPFFTFTYHADDQRSGLTEQELCHLLIGPYEGPLAPEPTEIDQWRWQSPGELRSAIEAAPDEYTPWLRIIMGNWKTACGP